MMFFEGRQAMLGHDPPIHLRSMTMHFLPYCPERRNGTSLPASPEPIAMQSYFSGVAILSQRLWKDMCKGCLLAVDSTDSGNSCLGEETCNDKEALKCPPQMVPKEHDLSILKYHCKDKIMLLVKRFQGQGRDCDIGVCRDCDVCMLSKKSTTPLPCS